MDRNQILRVVFGLLIALCIAGVSHARPTNVRGTVHNLSSDAVSDINYSMTATTNEDEICVFCHTPHGGKTDSPLWNHDYPDTVTFTHYNSATLTSAASNASRPVGAISLACLSCHDGSVAMNRVINPSNSNPAADHQPTFGGADQLMRWSFGDGPGPRIGGVYGGTEFDPTGNLSDDHPISFSYYDAWKEEFDNGDNGLKDPAAILALSTDDKPQFFGTVAAVAGGMQVECSSCHDPHVEYEDDPLFLHPYAVAPDSAYKPFLIMPNAGSALCLSCHNK